MNRPRGRNKPDSRPRQRQNNAERPAAHTVCRETDTTRHMSQSVKAQQNTQRQSAHKRPDECQRTHRRLMAALVPEPPPHALNVPLLRRVHTHVPRARARRAPPVAPLCYIKHIPPDDPKVTQARCCDGGSA